MIVDSVVMNGVVSMGFPRYSFGASFWTIFARGQGGIWCVPSANLRFAPLPKLSERRKQGAVIHRRRFFPFWAGLCAVISCGTLEVMERAPNGLAHGFSCNGTESSHIR
jgi:hypothetical protein